MTNQLTLVQALSRVLDLATVAHRYNVSTTVASSAVSISQSTELLEDGRALAVIEALRHELPVYATPLGEPSR